MIEMSRSIDLQALIGELKMETDYLPREAGEIMVHMADVGRPGLPLAGFFEHFEPERIQIIGNAEFSYMQSLSGTALSECLTAFLSHHPVAVIFTHGSIPTEQFLELAEYFEVPVLHTSEATSSFTAALLAFLNVKLAPCITRHGVLVEVYGEGILILGDSGVGKSETAIELIKRGHRLVADDAVELRRVSAKTIVGSAPEIIRHYIELRGIGIVDVRRLFGMGAVKDTEKVDMIINLETWVQGKMYDRLGLESEYMDIMGIQIPSTTIPVKPGRNLAIIIEIAAMNNRQKRMGYNTAEEFNKKLMGDMGLSER
ncbi:MAG: HPr(Ser) kinase/phosphatase [Ruminococcaceae bacterium]|nr:HPr(Ser) kinase/phosphatase [Oscillospiraceae bacterium]